MSIIGHQKIKSLLNCCIEKDSLSQAYIFSGPDGVGKYALALDFARKINNEEEMVIEENIIILSPEVEEVKGVTKKKDIRIENVRELQGKLGITTSKDKKKIAIIDEADRLTKSAQNSLLKTLEEPPQNTIIILIVRETLKLLPTIHSRCQNIKFNLLSDEEVGQIIPADNINKKEIIFWSQGRPGWAKRVLESENMLNEKKDLLEQLRKLLSANVSERFAFAESASKNLPKILETLDYWLIIFGAIILDKEKLLSVSKERALRLIDEIEKSKAVLSETNSNAKLVLENLLLNF